MAVLTAKIDRYEATVDTETNELTLVTTLPDHSFRSLERYKNLVMLSEDLRDRVGHGPASEIVAVMDPEKTYPGLHRLGQKG